MMYSVIKMPANAKARNATPDEFIKYITTPLCLNDDPLKTLACAAPDETDAA